MAFHIFYDILREGRGYNPWVPLPSQPERREQVSGPITPGQLQEAREIYPRLAERRTSSEGKPQKRDSGRLSKKV